MAADTKKALLDAAESVARSRGFDGFSYADLADAVGIRKASIHHHFPTKAALSIALMQRYHEQIEAICDQINVEDAKGGAALLALIDVYRSALRGGSSLCLCVSFSVSRESLPPDVIAQIKAFRAMLVSWLSKAFKEIGADSPSSEAKAALSLLEGSQLAARAEQDVATFDASVALLRQRVEATI